MTSGDLAPLANHLWQSTVFTGAMWILALPLRRNRAAVRYRLWLAASVKFLLPFSLLVSAGTELAHRSAPGIAPPQWSSAVDQMSRPFSASTSAPHIAPSAAASPLPAILLGIWICGIVVGILFWLRCWRQMQAARRAATPIAFDLPVPVLSSSTCLEPGVFGIHKPVLLLPDGITNRLAPAQLAAILRHEMCHVRRRDNLTAAIHMTVEVLFWFYPLVWWIRKRLIEEREHACDEEVLRLTDPQVYAEGILNVCKFYAGSPLACVSGVTGSDLKKRIERIMANHVVFRMTLARKLFLGVAGTLLLGGPVVIGLMNTPQGRAQSPAQEASGPEFEVASVKPNKTGQRGGRLNTEPGHLTITNMTLRTCIRAAFGLQNYQLTGGTASIEDEPYDIVAKAESAVGDEQLMLMLRRLLAERFKLKYHKESKEMKGLALLVGKNGPRLHPVEPAGKGWSRNGVGSIEGQEVSIPRLAEILAGRLGYPVVDLTAIKGVFDIKLNWTPDPDAVRNPAEEKESPAVSDPSGPSMFSALQEQLGLRLEARKVPVEIVAIDHVERPSAN
ncbi:MAG TPA: M56 and DUF3738 domain-containing protein [Bryobacteraceae bacterium]|nr:M56 and DUF3738 domain-containing protein [Bryobacteraceae bacterium]